MIWRCTYLVASRPVSNLICPPTEAMQLAARPCPCHRCQAPSKNQPLETGPIALHRLLRTVGGRGGAGVHGTVGDVCGSLVGERRFLGGIWGRRVRSNGLATHFDAQHARLGFRYSVVARRHEKSRGHGIEEVHSGILSMPHRTVWPQTGFLLSRFKRGEFRGCKQTCSRGGIRDREKFSNLPNYDARRPARTRT